jgi:sugar lactone lactonase YvrE
MLETKARALVLPLTLLVVAGCDETDAGPSAGSGETVFMLAGVGFDTPESALHDPVADVYLVSNIAGNPGDEDGNGFISRVSVDGDVLELEWIGAATGAALNAPKGMAIAGDELFVADIDAVRIFDRETGASVDEVAIDTAEFLNDLAADEAGSVFASDSARDAVYRIEPDRTWQEWVQDEELASPNGLVVSDEDLLVASSAQPLITRVNPDGDVVGDMVTPEAELDGLVQLPSGDLLVSSWAGGAIYRGGPGGGFSELFTGLRSPADIGLDSGRGRVLVPLFDDHALVAKALP